MLNTMKVALEKIANQFTNLMVKMITQQLSNVECKKLIMGQVESQIDMCNQVH